MVTVKHKNVIIRATVHNFAVPTTHRGFITEQDSKEVLDINLLSSVVLQSEQIYSVEQM